MFFCIQKTIIIIMYFLIYILPFIFSFLSLHSAVTSWGADSLFCDRGGNCIWTGIYSLGEKGVRTDHEPLQKQTNLILSVWEISPCEKCPFWGGLPEGCARCVTISMALGAWWMAGAATAWREFSQQDQAHNGKSTPCSCFCFTKETFYL